MPFIDTRTLGAGTRFEADVCIVGSGPVGTTLARDLANRGHRVVLLESGGFERDDRTEGLTEGITTGDPFDSLSKARTRRFGGMAHLWNSGTALDEIGFRCGSLHAVDLERRPWMTHSVEWPFGLDELGRWYPAAQEICSLGPCQYEGASWADDAARAWPLDPELFTTTVWQLGVKSTFIDRPRAELERDARVSVYLHATVAEICTDPAGGQVTHLRVRTLDGGEYEAHARYFVVAAGGIENARLLLLSRSARPAGLGNGHDLVGRFFMEHQFVHGGRLIPHDRALFARAALYDSRPVRGTRVIGKIDLTDAAIRRHELLNVNAAFMPRHRWHSRFDQRVADAAVGVVRDLSRARIASAVRRLPAVIRGVDYMALRVLRKLSGGRLADFAQPSPDLVAAESWSALPGQERRWHFFDVILHCEQSPHPDNRLTLDDSRDALGQPRARLHWEWRDEDQENVVRASKLFADGFQRAGIGTFELDLKDGRPNLMHPGLHHHMGTTRMHRSERQGVVDEHGRVHGTGNLFVGGYSVFPSGGYINPTLTIVALALRQGEHLSRRLATPIRVS
jgi:choline dehydrogenase-like flavoprotein